MNNILDGTVDFWLRTRICRPIDLPHKGPVFSAQKASNNFDGYFVVSLSIFKQTRSVRKSTRDSMWRQANDDAALRWCHKERDGVSNHQPHDCLLDCLIRHRWQKTSKLRVIGLSDGTSPVTGEFPAQRASNADNVSIWWRHHGNK